MFIDGVEVVEGMFVVGPINAQLLTSDFQLDGVALEQSIKTIHSKGGILLVSLKAFTFQTEAFALVSKQVKGGELVEVAS